MFASSIGAVDGYRSAGELRAAWDVPVFPTTAYGATKCFGEALGRVYAVQGLSCVCVRLCYPGFSQDGGRAPDPNVPADAEATAAQSSATAADAAAAAVEQDDGSGGWGPLRGEIGSGMSGRDCAELFALCAEAELSMLAGQPRGPPNFAIVNGISEHAAPALDPDVAKTVVGFVAKDGTAFPRARM